MWLWELSGGEDGGWGACFKAASAKGALVRGCRQSGVKERERRKEKKHRQLNKEREKKDRLRQTHKKNY